MFADEDHSQVQLVNCEMGELTANVLSSLEHARDSQLCRTCGIFGLDSTGDLSYV